MGLLSEFWGVDAPPVKDLIIIVDFLDSICHVDLLMLSHVTRHINRGPELPSFVI